MIHLLCFAFLMFLPFVSEARVVTDMRGIAVTIPDEPRRVATIDDGLVEGIMTHLGVIDRVKVIGSWSMKRDYRYRFQRRWNDLRCKFQGSYHGERGRHQNLRLLPG